MMGKRHKIWLGLGGALGVLILISLADEDVLSAFPDSPKDLPGTKEFMILHPIKP